MSQKKTVIPGLDSSNDPNFSPYSADPSFYARSTNAPKGTVVSDLSKPSGNSSQTEQAHQPVQQQMGKPVVGFLYSISRTALGEYWPLHIGPNTIGQSSSCDIVLKEGTVSSQHAEIIIRKMKKPIKIIASISDFRSTNGTMRNGESLDFSATECFNGDIITIGDNYEFLLILIDANELGLSVSENFISIANEETDSFSQEDVIEPGKTRPFQNQIFDPATPHPSPAGVPNGFQGSRPTVGLDGRAGTESGGTVGM